MSYRPQITIDYQGLTLSGTIITNDWAGDPSVPGGVQTYPPYVEDLSVKAGDLEIAGWLNYDAFNRLSTTLLVTWASDAEIDKKGHNGR